MALATCHLPCTADPNYDPNYTVVECIPSFCGPESPAKYEPTTVGAHTLKRLRAVNFGGTLAAAIASS